MMPLIVAPLGKARHTAATAGPSTGCAITVVASSAELETIGDPPGEDGQP
jgi:hypothetical protein